jgi:hypothetical protein
MSVNDPDLDVQAWVAMAVMYGGLWVWEDCVGTHPPEAHVD